MFESLPKEPILLLSVVNTKLRDYYSSLEQLCEDLSIEKDVLIHTLETIKYEYNSSKNQFV